LKKLLSLITGSILFVACKKTDYMLDIPVAKQACELQTANPSGKSCFRFCSILQLHYTLLRHNANGQKQLLGLSGFNFYRFS
jgi:hypothetical protein